MQSTERVIIIRVAENLLHTGSTVEGKAIWAGYSARSSTVYLSLPYG